ncbi:MAG: hypothetical protein ACRDF8_05445 [Chloroflexota bacterium]
MSLDLYALEHAISMAMSYGDFELLSHCVLSSKAARDFALLILQSYASQGVEPPWRKQVAQMVNGEKPDALSAEAEAVRSMITFDAEAGVRQPSVARRLAREQQRRDALRQALFSSSSPVAASGRESSR